MTTTQQVPSRSFTLEDIERLVWKNSDDMAVSIARSFERLEEHMNALESRLQERIGEFQSRDVRRK